jgi:hypothetical protein
MLLAAGGLYFIYSKEIALASMETEVALLKKDQLSATSVRHLLSDTKAKRQDLMSYLVTKDGVVGFIETIEKLAKETNTTISVNSVGVSPTKNQQLEHVVLTAEVQGAFLDVYWLLSLIEKMPQQLSVSRVYLEQLPSEDKKKPGNWRLVFTLQALKVK